MSIKAIRKSVKRSHEQLDEFEDGDVVRWVVRGCSRSYMYAAMKTAAGWFTTATTASPVEQVVDFDRLLEILSGPCVERIDAVAGAEPWTVVFEAHLLALPCKQAERKAPAAAPAAEVTEGIYRTAAGKVFKVQKAVHGSGKLYAKELIDGSFVYAPGAIRKLRVEDKMTLAEAQEYGRLYGVCIVCGRTLTDESSIEAGIGPTCVKKF